MKNPSPLSRYQDAISSGQFKLDNGQYFALLALDELYLAQRLSTHYHQQAWWRRLFSQSDAMIKKSHQGIYLWGSVGRGKTMLMDLFYESLPDRRKSRVHYQHFMQQIHRLINEYQGHSDPIKYVVRDLNVLVDVVCIDEFFVSDIGDAMLLHGILLAMFESKITVVFTSNVAPEELYKNGLQRQKFLPVIDAIKQHCQIIHLRGEKDHRRDSLTRSNKVFNNNTLNSANTLNSQQQAQGYFWPLNCETAAKMTALWLKLNHQQPAVLQNIELNQRAFQVIGANGDRLAVSFYSLCQCPSSAMDYILLAQRYQIIFLHNVPIFNAENEEETYRFISFIDEMYDRDITLFISAATEIEQLYQGDSLQFLFKRCASRLYEMQYNGMNLFQPSKK